MGEMLFQSRYEGDEAVFRDRRRRPPATPEGSEAMPRGDDDPRLWQAARTTLWTYVAVYLQHRGLSPAAAGALTLEHHRKLLSVHDTAARHALAEAAVRHGWSSRELAAAVRAYRCTEGRGGDHA